MAPNTNLAGQVRRVHILTGAFLVALTVMPLGLLFATATPSVAWQAQSAALLAHDATQVHPAHHVSLRYNPDGVQMLCPRSERGWTATVYGDGQPFAATCEKDGQIYVWDALSRP